MSNELIINASLPETRIALMENGEIQELLIERASGKGIVGNIYKGRVTRVLPGMQAAFVDIGLEKAAFLYVDDVYVHSEIWEEDEDQSHSRSSNTLTSEMEAANEPHTAEESGTDSSSSEIVPDTLELSHATQLGQLKGRVIIPVDPSKIAQVPREEGELSEELNSGESNPTEPLEEHHLRESINEDHKINPAHGDPEDFDDDSDDEGSSDPVRMGPGPDDADSKSKKKAASEEIIDGTMAPSENSETKDLQGEESSDAQDAMDGEDPQNANSPRRRHRRGRRGGRFRKKVASPEGTTSPQDPESYPENFQEQVADEGNSDSDRSALTEEQVTISTPVSETGEEGRPEEAPREITSERRVLAPVTSTERPEFRAPRSRDRRIRQKPAARPVRAQVNIQDLLKEGQEILVQVAKDPIATKGARLTCHISLPGRHLVCMPTIDHVGVSRRIEKEDERRRLREFVERNRPKNLGFIVRTASGKQQSEKRIKQDIEYLTRLWTEIKEKMGAVTAPALVYEDLNAVLRAVRDWVTEEIDKVIVDSRYHFNEIQRFVSHFMPPLKQKVELYHGDIPIFDAYGLSTELSRALERKVWLKSGGYIVIDQAEALVAIDVNTGRYVGKKNLEDTILKTNLEAVQEIAYQLRLRNCGGIIIIDLIDMEKEENKQRVYRALEEGLTRDRARPSILKISELGLIEMTRKRTRDTIVRSLCESCTHCEGKGFIKSKQTVAYEVMREIEREGIERDIAKILVQAHQDVIDILAIDERETLDQLERRYRKLIYLQSMNDFHPEQFEVTADKKERSERGTDRQSERTAGDSPNERTRGRERNERDRDRGERGRQEGGPVQIPVPHTSLPVPISASASSDDETTHDESPESVVVEPKIRPLLPDPHGTEATPGNMSSSSGPTSMVPRPLGTPLAGGGPRDDGFYDEEDRLAFLRAQAAQDAALARLGTGGTHHNSGATRPATDSNNRGVPINRRTPRGRRGGKFRRGNDRTRDRTTKPFGYNTPGQKWNESAKESATPATPEPSEPSTGIKDSDNGSSGDQSPPSGT